MQTKLNLGVRRSFLSSVKNRNRASRNQNEGTTDQGYNDFSKYIVVNTSPFITLCANTRDKIRETHSKIMEVKTRKVRFDSLQKTISEKHHRDELFENPPLLDMTLLKNNDDHHKKEKGW